MDDAFNLEGGGWQISGCSDPVEKIPCFQSPEKRLWAGVLLQAFKDLRPGNNKAQQKAMRWFRSNTERAGSFLWICYILDLNPARIRRGLSRKARSVRV
jgi:hypothetical protein